MSTRALVFWLSFTFIGLVLCQTSDRMNTLGQIRKNAEIRSDGSDQLIGPILGADSTPTICPNPRAIGLLKQQIAYVATEELNPFKGLSALHIDVWQRGPLTAFYIHDKLAEFDPSVRMAYIFGKTGLESGGTCSSGDDWRKCVDGFVNGGYINYVTGTCNITLDANSIPAWKPSPNNEIKRRVAQELRSEIEVQWEGVQEIVVRDFNLNDNQIIMYLKMPDREYYQGCSFHAMNQPHCDGWHLFGQAPISSIRKRVFEKPYRLK